MPFVDVKPEDLANTQHGTAARFVQTYARKAYHSPGTDLHKGDVMLDVAHVAGVDRSDMLHSLGAMLGLTWQEIQDRFDAAHERVELTQEQFDHVQRVCTQCEKPIKSAAAAGLIRRFPAVQGASVG